MVPYSKVICPEENRGNYIEAVPLNGYRWFSIPSKDSCHFERAAASYESRNLRFSLIANSSQQNA